MNIKFITISIFILAYAQPSTFVLTVQKVRMLKTENDAEELTFGANWALDSGNVAGLPILGIVMSSPVTRLYNSAGSVLKKLSFKSQFLFGSEAQTQQNGAYYAMINSSNKLKCYGPQNMREIVLNILNNVTVSNASIYDKNILIYSQNKKMLYLINMQQNEYSAINFNLGKFVDFSLKHDLTVLYVYDENLTYRFLFWVGNVLTTIPQIQMIVNKPYGSQKGKIFYQSSTKLLSRYFQKYVQVYNTEQKNLYRNLSSANSGKISNSVLCNRYIVFSILNKIYFYDVQTLELKKTINSSTLSVYQLKCFEERNQIGASYFVYNPLGGIIGGSSFQVHYYLLSVQEIQGPDQPTTPEQEDSQAPVDPQTQQPESQNEQEPIGPSDQETNPPRQTSLMGNFEDIASSFLKNKETKQTLEVISTFTGALSFLSFGHHLMRPLLNFLQDFWYYQFHVIQYPEIVQIFTKEVDLLNEFRIRPQFLNFQFQIEKLNEQNNKYVNVLKLHDRQPEQIYVLKSLKNIYINNFLYSFICFLILKIITKIIKNCEFINPNNKIIYSIYKYLCSCCYWWCLFVTCIQANISALCFFTSLQFNVFSSFEFIDFINLITCLFLMFLPLFYSFCMYVIIFSWESKSKSNDLFGLSKYSQKGLGLEMSLNCICPYLQALSHGLFINRHFLQIISLLLMDLLQIFFVIHFRKQFNYKIDMVVHLMYKMVFLCFNLNIFMYSFYGKLEIQYNFIFLVIICGLIVLTILKFIVSIGQMIYQKCKNFCKKQKQQDIQQNTKIKTKINVFQVTCKNIDEIQRNKHSFSKQKVKKQKYSPNATLFIKRPNKVTFVDGEERKTDSIDGLTLKSHKQQTSIKLIKKKNSFGGEEKERDTKSKIKTIKLAYFGRNKRSIS